MGSTEDAWPAPAKLNLMLRVVGRRPDGYHELQTVFQFLDAGDALRFERRDDGVIRAAVEHHGIPAEGDLCVRAARALQQASGSAYGATIELDKRLPIGGGLGGGSSDAATTLHALNRLWDLWVPTAELAALGLRLGADVPVFIHGHAAWAEGVGERCEAIALPEPWYLVVVPSCEVATADVFQAPELTRDSPRITIRDFLAGTGGNDCLPVVQQRYPEVAAAYDWLSGVGEARLTGTGACVFVAFDTEDAAKSAHRRLPSDWRGFVARGVNRSPLLARLERG